jgi:hypothetical protein
MNSKLNLTWETDIEEYGKDEYKKLLVDCLIITSWASDIRAMLANQLYAMTVDPEIGALMGKPNSTYRRKVIEAFTEMFAYLQDDPPFKEMVTEAQAMEAQRLSHRFEQFEQQIENEKEYGDYTREANERLKMRVRDARKTIGDFVQSVSDAEATHAERRGMLTLLKNNIHHVLSECLDDASDIPF